MADQRAKFVVRQDALRNIFEALFMVLRQQGRERNDDKDEIIALCPNKFHALKIARLLKEDEIGG